MTHPYRSMPVPSWPTPWIAAVLGFISPPLGMLYVGRAVMAAFYCLLTVSSFILDEWLNKSYPSPLWNGPLSATLALMIACAIHGYSLARATGVILRPWYSQPQALFLLPVGILAAFFSVRAFLIESYDLPSASMSPTLVPGDNLFVVKWPYGNYNVLGLQLFRSSPKKVRAPRRFDMMVFEGPGDREQLYVKRVIGLPGDLLMYQDKQLLINREPVNQQLLTQSDGLAIYQESFHSDSYQVELTSRSSRDFSLKIPAGHYFMMGDNRDLSNDSRNWGPVPIDHMVGKVVWVW